MSFSPRGPPQAAEPDDLLAAEMFRAWNLHVESKKKLGQHPPSVEGDRRELCFFHCRA